MQISFLNVIFGRCTAETRVTLNVSNPYTNKTVYRFSEWNFREKPKTKAELRIIKGKRNKLNLSIGYPPKLGLIYNIV
ncbi:MAG: hypothetical protein IJZ50_08250 [Alistipes sp.]|nr:hypothetical protein [Alistipes sp.]